MFLREVISQGKTVAVNSAVVAGGAVASGLALADTAVDVSGITDALASAATAIGVVGAAMLVAAGAGIAFKWVMGFLFS